MSSGDQDNVLQYLQIVRQLGYAGYLTLDTLTVLDAAGIRKSAAAKRWQAQAYKAWFVGLAASVVAGGYANYRLSVRAREVDEKDPDKKVEGKVIQRYVFMFSLSRFIFNFRCCFALGLLGCV